MKKQILSLLLISALCLPACGREPTVPETTAEITTEEQTTVPEPTTLPADRAGESVYQEHPELTPVDYDSPALLPKTPDAGQKYIDGITFLCDSPCYWLKLYGLLSDGYDTKQVWTGKEGTMTLAYLRGFPILDPIDGVERTIPETVAAHKPPMILITVGVNGVAFMDEAYFTEEYENLIGEIQKASPKTEIVLQSILPITPRYRGWGDITNATITEANSWMLKIAEKHSLYYLDSFSCLLAEDGNADPELMQSDGLHPNKEGLTRVLNYIRRHSAPSARMKK